MKLRKNKIIVGVISSLFLLAQPSASWAGCAINIKIKNADNKRISVSWGRSKVKTKGGAWKKVQPSPIRRLQPGEELGNDYNAVFGCNKKRQYKFHFVKEGANWTQYYPSPNSFTTKTNIVIRAKF